MNATISEINSCFDNLLRQRGVYRSLCKGNDKDALRRMYNQVRSVRSRMKQGKPVTIDFKLKWLLRSGWRPGHQKIYTESQVVELISDAIKLSREARQMGGAFVLQHIQSKK